MSFTWDFLLWTLLLIPGLVAFYLWLQLRRKKFAVRYASLGLVRDALGRGPGWKRHVPPILLLLAFATMLVALARPTATVKLPSNEANIILTMDISRSMEATDVLPTRLEAAKAAAMEMVNSQPENVSIGVVQFAGAASIILTPTTDRAAVAEAIHNLIPQNATAIGSAIQASVAVLFGLPPPVPQQFQRGLPPPTPTPMPPVPLGSLESGVVVLLSDGQSNSGPNPLEVVSEAANRGVRIYTIGLGSPAGAVVRFGGRAVRVQLDERTLRTIATATGGQYFNAQSDTDLREIYRNLGSQVVFKDEETELTFAFTAAAAILLLGAATLSMLWFSRTP